MCKNIVKKYNDLTDEELIIKVRQNDEDAFEVLFYRYLSLLKYIISKNYCAQGDFEDMLQDATISFYYAVQMFDFHSASFSTFLTLCVERSLKSTIKKAAAKKRIPNDLIVSIEDETHPNIKAKSAEEEFFVRETGQDFSEQLKNSLSDLELKVLNVFLETGSYDETATKLGLSRKSVDNALFRIRKKFNS